MTRKKSNVKALALAVTCAILAGGYSGLNPVYAATPVYHDVVKYDSVNQTLDYEYNAGGGIGTAAIQKIKFGNVVLDGSDSASPIITVGSGTRLTDGKIIAKNGLYVGSSTANDGTGSYFSVGGSDGSINAANGKFNVSGAGAITATSLSLGTMNDVAATINSKAAQTDVDANKTNIATNQTRIQSLDGKIDTVNTNIRRDMANEVSTINTKIDTKLDTSTFGAYTTSNDAAVNDLKNKTQNIKVAKDTIVTSSDATYIDGITHAGGVRLADNGVRAKELVLEEEFADHTSAQATLTREGLAALNSMVYDEHDKINIVDGKPVIQAGNGSVVGGVKFDNKNITNVDSVMVNKDATNQVQINSEGIVVGLHSTVIGSDGVYAGGHTEATAKAVLGADGSIKGAGDGTGKYKFTVDGATGNVVSKGSVTANQAGFNDLAVTNGLTVGSATGDFVNMQNGNVVATGSVTAKGGLSAANGKFSVDGTNGNTVVGGKLTSKGDFSVGDDDQFTVDAATGNVVSKGKITSDRAKIGAVEIANDGTITGVKAITTDTLTVNNGFITNGNIESKGLKVNGNAEITGTLGVNGAVTGASFNGATIDATHFNNVTLSGGNVEANSIKGTTLTDGIAKMNGGKVTAQNGVEVDANNYLNSSGLKTSNIDASQATIGKIEIKGSKIKSTEADGTVGIAGITVNDAGALNNVNFIDGVSIGAVTGGNGLQFGGNAVVGATNKPFSSTGYEVDGEGNVKGKSFKVNDANYLDSTGLTAKAATIGGVNKLDNTGIDTSGKLHVGGQATFGDSTSGSYTTVNGGTVTVEGAAGNKGGTTTTIAGGKITTDTLDVQDIVLRNQMKDGSGNTITISGSDGSMSVASGKFAVDKDGQLTNEYTGHDAAGKTTKTTLKTSVDGIKANYTNSVNDNNNLLNINKDGVALGVTDSSNNNLGMLSADKEKATMGYGTANSIVVGANTIESKVGTDASRTLKATEIVDAAGGMTITTNNTGTTFSNGTNTTLINGSSITSNKATGDTGLLDGSNLTLKVTDAAGNVTRSTELTAGGATFTKDGKTTTISGNTITTGKLVTDELVITGKGDAAGDGGSIAFGGNGTIKSNIKGEGGTVDEGKETTFETKLDGVNTKVTDGTTTTENKVTAAGNSNTVTKDATHKSEFNQGLTSIGGVVTNGTVKIAQTLDGDNGNITNEVTDKDGKSSKLVQSGTGLTYTDSANIGSDGKPTKETIINSSDVSIGSAKNEKDRINLSDLGQIDDLDGELTARSEYTSNKTAVGAINAEAAIRREEVARLDNRIDDVNNRVDKVGAMAAAIASLKSIGYDPQAPSEFSIGLGQYKGETGVAMGFFHYPNKNFMINVSLSTAGGETMGGIGATWRFGHKSPQKLLEEQREAQARKELAAAEKYQAAAKLAKEAQERAEYAAKLARQAQVSADNAKAAADATQAKHFQ